MCVCVYAQPGLWKGVCVLCASGAMCDRMSLEDHRGEKTHMCSLWGTRATPETRDTQIPELGDPLCQVLLSPSSVLRLNHLPAQEGVGCQGRQGAL